MADLCDLCGHKNLDRYCNRFQLDYGSLFGKTVLSVDWWKKYIFTNFENGRRRQEQQKSEDANMTFASNHHITQSKSQSLVQVKKLSKWNDDDYDLINKKVISCEMVDIGYISRVENQFMTIIRNGRSGQQQYVIPTYYVREHDNERVLIDTSVRYLDRYQIRESR